MPARIDFTQEPAGIFHTERFKNIFPAIFIEWSFGNFLNN